MIGWAGLLLVPGAIAVVTERAGWCGDRIVAVLQLLLPWWGLVAIAVGAAGAATATWWLVAVAAAVMVGVGVVIGPKLLRGRRRRRPTPSGTAFSVGLANLHLDNPEPGAAARQLLTAAPEILVLTELTPELLAAFDAAGGRDRFPNRIHREPLRGEYEAGIFSTYPISDARVHAVGSLRVVEAVATLPDRDVRVVAVHPEAPTSHDGFRQWRAQLRVLRDLLAAAAPATIVLGDFNSGTTQPPYEALVATQFRDAHDVVGRSLLPSWGVSPSLPRWVPTFVARLDHLLVGPAVEVVEVDDLDAVGSDHRPFVAGLVLGD